MPTGSLLALLDDITSVLDDVATMTKVAAHKTAGVLGDDLALNAQQVSGVRAERELPVVFAVARGSLVNKAILVPSALAISAATPWLVTPLLMLGGAYLCFEGAEKLAHKLFHSKAEKDASVELELLTSLADPNVDPLTLEKEKIKGAVRTDFVLSAEIVTIALGSVADYPFITRVLVLSGIGILMTVGVYGLVACIVKLDDLGFFLARSRSALRRKLGEALVAFAPYLMRTLTVVGTAAMFLVGGSIVSHGIPPIHNLFHHASEQIVEAASLPLLDLIVNPLFEALFGILAGALCVLVLNLFTRLFRKPKTAQNSP